MKSDIKLKERFSVGNDTYFSVRSSAKGQRYYVKKGFSKKQFARVDEVIEILLKGIKGEVEIEVIE